MSLEIHVLGSLPEQIRYRIADHVSEYTNGLLDEKPQMLPVSPEEVLNKQIACIALKDKSFAGVVGATFPEEHNGHLMPEVGTLWVPQEHRRQKIAHWLVSTITNELLSMNQLPYAFCNSLSQPIFIETGFRLTVDGELPSNVYEACKKCPVKPSAGCCDTSVIYSGEAV